MRLSWDPSDFGGVTMLRISANRIWLPDIRLYNGSVQTQLENMEDSQCESIGLYLSNKCIGDDTKAAARQSPNCIKKQ